MRQHIGGPWDGYPCDGLPEDPLAIDVMSYPNNPKKWFYQRQEDGNFHLVCIAESTEAGLKELGITLDPE